MLYITDPAIVHTGKTAKALRAVDGYLFLGLFEEAFFEFGSIPETERRCGPVMLAEVRVLIHMKKWKKAQTLSKKGIALYPDEGEFIVQYAFTLLQQGQGKEVADEVLLRAPKWLFLRGILHYNLCCYQARLGNIEFAQKYFEIAISINSDLRKTARADSDLKVLFE